ncbi:MAG: hypothetical protein WCJ56_09770 [bacterium]
MRNPESQMKYPYTIDLSRTPACREVDEAPQLPGAKWYEVTEIGEGLSCAIPVGKLAGAAYLTVDLLLPGMHLGVFQLKLCDSSTGRAFLFTFGLLNECQARVRLPLEAMNQNRWQLGREGALLKPLCYGDALEAASVDSISLTVLRKSDRPLRWAMTPLIATTEEPELLTDPLLPYGPLLDEMGQSTLHEWPGKTRSTAEVSGRLQGQLQQAHAEQIFSGRSRWGGLEEVTWEATGFFHTHYDGKRWWLVDPDGHPFWSAGLDCIRVDTTANYAGLEKALQWLSEDNGPYAPALHGKGPLSVNYLAANLIRAFGSEGWRERWVEIALGQLRGAGFNTVGNWSEWQYARAAGVPYVRPLDPKFPNTPCIYRDFPDLWHPAFGADLAQYAEQLRDTVYDPALIGYFPMNEPMWGFATFTPAEGMLRNTDECGARAELLNYLTGYYHSESEFTASWGDGASYAHIKSGRWQGVFNAAAKRDLENFSSIIVELFFVMLRSALHAVDPNHLNLGVRYYQPPPEWTLAGMRHFDVFSMNCYQPRVSPEEVARIVAALDRPVIIGEWHFGALDVGLPGSGIGHVRDQATRGQAYRVYLEQAASIPGCVGVHYFTMYDESALGRFDGENWNIGFYDVCNRPYDELVNAAKESHARLYQVASGEIAPYDDAPEYLPRLFN